MQFSLKTIGQSVIKLKKEIEKNLKHQCIFQKDAYVPSFVHFIEKDKQAVKKMGNIFKRFNSAEPLVLFDKIQAFKCFQLDHFFKSYIKLPVIDHIEGD